MRIQAVIACVFSLAAVGQNTGRFAVRVSRGLEAIDKGHFNNAINVLEEVWEEDQTDPVVPENLGMAYLYADKDAAKAAEYMERAIAMGGRASFLMQHSHEKVAALDGDMSDYCTGRLSIYRDRLAFVASNPAHSFTIPAGQFLEIKTNRVFARAEGGYHIKTVDKKNYNLRPRSWSDRETRLVLSLTDKYLKGR